MSRTGSGRYIIGTLIHTVLLGLIAAVLAGTADFALARAAFGRGVPASDLLAFMLFYALFGGALGIIVGLAAAAVSQRRPRSRPSARALGGTVVVAATLLVTVGAYVNSEILPSMTAPVSIAFDVALLVTCAVLATLVTIVAGRRERHRAPSRWTRSPVRLTAIACAVLVTAAALIPAEQQAVSRGTRPETPSELNVLLLVVDALRPDHLGCYGYERETSPNLDRLAEEGTLFLSAYSQSPYTLASTATLATSLYPSTHGVRGVTRGIPDAAPVLMEEVRNLGYRTAVLSANAFVSSAFGFGRGADYVFCRGTDVTKKSSLGKALKHALQKTRAGGPLASLLDRLGRVFPNSMPEFDPYVEHAGRLNGALLDWIDAEPDVPFFAYVHYMEPHTPLAAPPPYDTLFDDRPAAPHEVDFPWRPIGILPFVTAEALPPSEHERLVAQYDATIAYFDAELGTLIEGLKARGLDDRTLVMVTADHGEEFHDHGGWGHGVSVFEELIRVPLVVWAPGRVPGGRSPEEPVRHIDITPTLLASVEAPPKPSYRLFEGQSYWQALTGETEFAAGLPVFAELAFGHDITRTLRSDNMKLIYARSKSEERLMLFDLESDPLEQHDLAASLPDVRNDLHADLVRMSEEMRAKEMESPEHQLDEATEEVLRALGYIQ